MSEDKIKCEFCEKSFSKFGLKSHIWRKHGEGVNFKPTLGRTAWNKGKTKDTDENVKKSSETLKRNLESGKTVIWSTGKTKYTDERILKQSVAITDTVNNKIEAGTWHNSFSKSRTHSYKGYKLYGTWELKFAMWLDENNINWIQNKQTFPYVYNGKHLYCPDFYLPDINCFIEIKGWKTMKDEAKWNCFSENLLILSGVDLQNLGIDITVAKDWKYAV